MINWRELPFVRLIGPLILGILFGNKFDPNAPFPWWSWTLFLLLLLGLSLQKKYQYRWLFGASAFCFLFLMGTQLIYWQNDLNKPDHFSRFLHDGKLVIAKIIEEPKHKNKIRICLDLEKIRVQKGTYRDISGILLVFLDPDSMSQKLSYGDRMALKLRVQKIQSPLNPKQIDFKKYYHLQNIHYQSFVPKNDWIRLPGNKKFGLLQLASDYRQKFLSILRQHLGTAPEYAVGAALILGYKNDLSEEMKTAYAQTGAAHILAVSGMHVGLFGLLISFLLSWTKYLGPHYRWIKNWGLLFGLWSFALLTGASTPVIRAAFMFSLVLIGLGLRRNPNIYNVIAASAFCLLCYNPYYLFGLSFQLSYSAVLGIVFFYPWLHKVWYLKFLPFQFLWKLSAVAISAQLATLPLTLYYFHQFPVCFLLSGWVVVPLAPFILGLGFALLFLNNIPYLGFALGKLLYGLIWLMNSAINLIQAIPQSLIEGIWISPRTVFFCYCLLVLISIALHQKNFRLVLGSTFILLLLTADLAFDKIQNWKLKQFTVYHIPKASLIDFSEGLELKVWKSEDLDREQERSVSQNNRLAMGLNPPYESLPREGNCGNILLKNHFMQFLDCRLAIVKPFFVVPDESVLKVDYILLHNSPKISLKMLVGAFQFKKVIVDGSNSFYSVKAWKEEAKALGISLHLTAVDGAFVCNLNTNRK